MTDPTPLRLLILDDEGSIVFAMTRYFKLQGWDVESTADLAQAQVLIRQQSFDLLITDLRLSLDQSAEGLEMASFTHQVSPRTKVIVLTAYMTPALQAESLGCHVDLMLKKPLSLPELTQQIRALIANRKEDHHA